MAGAILELCNVQFQMASAQALGVVIGDWLGTIIKHVM
jgi:hypothetical protein